MIKDDLGNLEKAEKFADIKIEELSEKLDIRLKAAWWYWFFVSYYRNHIISALRKIAEFAIITLDKFFFRYIHEQDKESVDVLYLPGHEVHTEITRCLDNLLREAKYKTELVRINGRSNKYKVDSRNIAYNVFNNIELYYLACRYNRILNKFAPKVVITFMESSVGAGVIAYLGKLKNIIIINIAHALTLAMPLFRVAVFDYYFVYGKKSKENILKINGFIDGKILPIGALKLDNFFLNSNTSFAKNNIRRKIFFASQWETPFLKEFREKPCEILKKVINNNENYDLIIKKHPLEITNNDHFINKMFEDLDRCRIYSGTSDLKLLLIQSDIIVIIWSAIGLEAAILGKPVIVVNPEGLPDWFNYVESGFALECRNTIELQSAIERIYDNYDEYVKKAKGFVDMHLSNQGCATKKAFETIKNILNNVRNNK